MKYILTPEEIRNADRTAIEELNIPGIILMENAARSSAIIIDKLLSLMNKPVVNIFCGCGNNGGDGFALARHLNDLYNINIFWIGSKEKMSSETLTNYTIAEKLGIPTTHLQTEFELDKLMLAADCFIDAMIGVGGSEDLRGIIVPILKKINNINALKIAIDSPSGLNTESGRAHADSFRAEHTITMFAIKTGMLINDGIGLCGKISKACLGAPTKIAKELSSVQVIEENDPSSLLPTRRLISSKFDYGRVVVIAGSKKYPGAAALCSNAAINSGSGLVELFTTLIHPSVQADIIPQLLPANSEGGISKHGIEMIMPSIEKANTVAIGPGLGNSPETIDFVRELLLKIDEEKAVVIDADGLLAINQNAKLRKNIILTPHTGEFSRITGIPRDEVELNTHELAIEWSEKLNCTLLIKHVPTIISNSEKSYWNTIGNPGMATGGCGDVLTGIISGLLARGVEAVDAAALGAYIHALAGDLFASKYSQETLTASSLIPLLKEVFPK